MPVDLSSLSDLPSRTGGWRPLAPADLVGPDLTVLCFDQSLSNTGFVELRREDGSVSVVRASNVRPPESNLTSFEQDYAQALDLELKVYGRLLIAPKDCVIVHETPPVINKRTLVKVGPRAGVPSRMGGQAIRSANARHRSFDVVMVNAQQAKRLVCGNARADKREAHDALRALTWVDELDLALRNEHVRDAMLLGLVVLGDRS